MPEVLDRLLHSDFYFAKVKSSSLYMMLGAAELISPRLLPGVAVDFLHRPLQSYHLKSEGQPDLSLAGLIHIGFVDEGDFDPGWKFSGDQ